MHGAQARQIKLRGYTFEVQVTPHTVKFFEIARIPGTDAHGRVLQTHIPLGAVSCSVSARGDALHVSSGSITLDPARFAAAAKKDPAFARLSEAHIMRLEESMLRTAARMIFNEHPSISRITGGILDVRSMTFIEGETLFRVLRGDAHLGRVLAQSLAMHRVARMKSRMAAGRPEPPKPHRRIGH